MKNTTDIYRYTLRAVPYDNENVSIYICNDRTGEKLWLSTERRHRCRGRDRCDILDLFPMSIAQVLERRVLNSSYDLRKSPQRTDFLRERLPQLLRYAEDEFGFCFFDRTEAKRKRQAARVKLDKVKLDKERKPCEQESAKDRRRDETDEDELMYA